MVTGNCDFNIKSDTINWRYTTHFDSEDDYRTGCWNVSHCHQESLFRDYVHLDHNTRPTYETNDSWVQTFHSFTFTWTTERTTCKRLRQLRKYAYNNSGSTTTAKISALFREDLELDLEFKFSLNTQEASQIVKATCRRVIRARINDCHRRLNYRNNKKMTTWQT